MKANKLILLIGLLLATSASFAQLGMSYQAVLRDGSGQRIENEAVDIRISILDDLTGTTVLYQEEHSTTTSSFGAVRLTMGEGNNTGAGLVSTLDSVDWKSAQRFLQVEYQNATTAGYVDLGTTPFYAVPYAFHAKTSDQTYEVSELTDVDTAGIQIGQTLIWNGTTWQAGTVDTVLLASTADTSSYADTASFASTATWADTAQYSLNADTAIYAQHAATADSAGHAMYSDTASFAYNALNSWDLNGNTTTASSFIGTTDATDLRFVTNSLDRMVIKADGKIGVGTTSPLYDLDIVGDNGLNIMSTLGSGASQTFIGDRLVWYPKQAHFYAGGGTLTQTDVHRGNYSFATGYNVYSRGDYSFAMGDYSQAYGNYSFAGGLESDAIGDYSLSFGYNCTSGGECAVSMGRQTAAAGEAAVALGYHVRAIGDHSVAFGYFSEANDTSSYAMGYRARSNHKGAFVYADASSGLYFDSEAENQFIARISNGAKFYSSSNLSTGVELLAGAGAWSTLSDSTKKENINKIEGKDILNKLSQLEVYEWNYKTQPDSIVHIGPMSQDFMAAFGYGESDKMISTVDIDGVNMAALKGLFEKAEDLEEQLQHYKQLEADYEKLLQEKEEMLRKLEQIEELMSAKSSD